MRRTINHKNALRPAQSHPNPTHWENLRVLKMAEQGSACACCPNDINNGYQLELHHRHYENWGNEQADDVVILCSLCHEYITSRFRMTDEYKVDAGTYAPPRPGLPPVEIHEQALPSPAAQAQRPGLPAVEPPREDAPTGTNNVPTRVRPF